MPELAYIGQKNAQKTHKIF